MSRHLDARRRNILRAGRSATLRRQTGFDPLTYADVTLLVTVRRYRPDQFQGGVRVGDAQAETLDNEIRAVSWPGPPRAGDVLELDGAAWQVVGAARVFDGPALIGHTLWIRGGG